MALGVLEDNTLKHVPGTVYVLDDASRTAVEAERDTHSKRDKTGRIILVPQPSDSPDDPLVRLSLFRNAGYIELTGR
jgi:hypothetical protein